MRIQLQHALVIATGPDGIAQSRKPSALDQGRVKGKLSASHAASIKHIDVIRTVSECGVFELFGLLDQLLDSLLLRGIGGTVSLSDETVVRVFTGVHPAHGISPPPPHAGR